MSLAMNERFKRAARDGYLNVLQEATRKDCNAGDEDGITPTLWAAFAGNLDALRTLVGRGGDPGKCDHLGSTALHMSSANGHLNCVSFLVSFGVNLWSLDNDYHTAKDVAAINHHEDVIQFLDNVIAKQSALNTKVVQKMKEKSIIEAEKRIKAYQKLQKKATKRAEKEEKMLEKQRKKIIEVIDSKHKTANLSVITQPNQSIITRKDSRPQQNNSSLKFSDIVKNQSNGTTNKIKILSAVSRRVQQKKLNADSISAANEFKVRDVSGDDCTRSVRSLTGIRRDSQILYVPKFDTHSNYETNYVNNNRIHMKDVFNGQQIQRIVINSTSNLNVNSMQEYETLEERKTKLYRTISEPDFLNNFEDIQTIIDRKTPESSIFVRPGFGSVSFRGKFTPETLFSKHLSDESNGRKESDISSVSYADSIGSAGSLAHRNELELGLNQVWDEDEDIDHNVSKTIPILLFLYAHGLKDYLPLFLTEKIDLEALILLNEDDFISLGIPLGPRRKILKAIDRRKQVMANPGAIRDTRL
ncbi:ankyrin repeat and SAM domain-containing protein 4B-like [Oppia nitens]|uniref:ankyrin repeat and SAM domain-containing protein 4B-like n=1 Tax=Oppia nitens TaxID=1686743 RepID=UPI0023D9AC01|nr:ankyrin repeat and SAM domain-containing protein 4B-like [Oppia nitens]